MRNKKLVKKILAYTVAPSLAISCFVLISFVYLQTERTQAMEAEKFALAEHLVTAQPSAFAHPETFERVAQALLAVKPLRSVSLFDRQGRLLASEGLPSTSAASLADMNPIYDRAHQWYQNGIIYRMIPLAQKAGPAPGERVVIEMDSAFFSVLQHRSTILLLLMAGAAVAAAFYFANRLRVLIMKPLQQLQDGLDNLLAGSQREPVHLGDDSGFQGIADAIGELVKKQQQEQDAMQSHLEEYTQELRETLETVEIQNIELDMARKNALQSSRAKSEFLANASHELRTPLNGIIGFSNLLLKTSLSNQQTDYLTTIEQSAQGLLTIINDILDISRLETGQLILEYKAASVYQTIEDVLKVHAPSAHEKKLRLITLIDPHVPENLLGDPLRLKQVIANLVSNAVKFSDKGTIVIRVNFIGETDNQAQLKFSVSDSGIGLTLDQQNGLFESFSQTDTADNRLHGGTGLGLAIARGLVQRMHGEIGVESEPGRGATFWFTARLGLNNRKPATNRQNNSLSHTRVIVYDNDSLGRSELTHLMNTWGADYVETDRFDQICSSVSQQPSDSPIQLAIIDAQINEQLFDKHQLRLCIERLNNEHHIAVIVLAVPNICRMLEPMLDKLQAVAVPRPISHNQLHRTICAQLGITSHAASEAALQSPARKRRSKPARVLAVDDNAANLRLVSELLKTLEAQVDVASSGTEALKLCATKSFDLILMDIQMPGMDGLEVTRRLREQEQKGKRTPVVALTAHAVNEQKTRLLLAGMDDYLSKPVSDVELRHVIDRWANNGIGGPTPATKDVEAGETAQEKTDCVFDIQEALERAHNKPDLAFDMFNLLISSLEETHQVITAAQQEKDMTTLRETVHKFYGGCCYCGVPALRVATERLHRRLQQEAYEDLDEAVAVLLARIAELQNWVENQKLENVFFG